SVHFSILKFPHHQGGWRCLVSLPCALSEQMSAPHEWSTRAWPGRPHRATTRASWWQCVSGLPRRSLILSARLGISLLGLAGCRTSPRRSPRSTMRRRLRQIVAGRLRTKPSTRRLSDVARHVVIPEGIVSTGWPGVEAKCREWGDEFDCWQADAGRVILAKRADGLYAATVGGVTLSIARQVAKTFLVTRIIFALCVLFPGLKVLWTAHHTATLGNTFRSLL